jgi:hypothetical protein
MENKYKLIKAFPGRKEVGLEVTFGDWGLTGECYQGKVVNTTVRYSKEAIENFPEFWKKIGPFDYEILKIEKGSVIYIKNALGSFDTVCTKLIDYEEIISMPEIVITQVKRLSDGVVFSIGDRIVVQYTHQETKRNIRKFTLSDSDADQILVSIDDAFDKSYSGGNGCALSVCHPYTNPVLFVSEDGVEMYEGDSYYYIGLDLQVVHLNPPTTVPVPFPKYKSKDRAETFLFEQTKLLSIADLKRIGINPVDIKVITNYLKEKSYAV